HFYRPPLPRTFPKAANVSPRIILSTFLRHSILAAFFSARHTFPELPEWLVGYRRQVSTLSPSTYRKAPPFRAKGLAYQPAQACRDTVPAGRCHSHGPQLEYHPFSRTLNPAAQPTPFGLSSPPFMPRPGTLLAYIGNPV